MKKILMVILFAFLLCIAFGCQKAEEAAEEPTVDIEADTEAIKAWFDQYTSIIRAGDVDSLLSLYVENIVILPPNGSTVEGQDAFRQFIMGWFGEYFAEENLRIQEIMIFGKNALARGSHNYRNIHKESGVTKEGKGTFINLFELQSDGTWKCTHNMWTSVAMAEPEEQPTWHDIDYVGDGIVGHRLDIYLPDNGPGPFPVVVYIYGSAFFYNNRKGSVKRSFAPALLKSGIAVVAINHRGTKVDDVIFPTPVHDVKAAIRFIRANAPTYNLDPSRIGATGLSSGGHLVAFLGTSGGVTTQTVGEVTMDIEGSLGAHTDVSSSVQAVCDWFGPTDFLVMDSCGSEMKHDAPDSPESVLIGGPIQEHPDECALANPTTYIDSDDPPFLIIHGDKDPLVPFCNSESLDAALDKAGVSSDYILVKGAGHGDGLFEPEYLDKMVQFFKKHLIWEK